MVRPRQAVVTVDWSRVSDAATAKDFAARVRGSTRSSAGLTAIGDALLASGAAFQRLGAAADRRVIDLSGDGMANIGPAPGDVRDGLVAEGITINGLAILKTEPWLDQYYDMNVVGGDHSFLLKVDDFPHLRHRHPAEAPGRDRVGEATGRIASRRVP